jgi:hypothetical protein
MRAAFLVAITVLHMPASAGEGEEQVHDHHRVEAVSRDDRPIRVTINPEARLSVTLAGAMPPPAPCGTSIDLSVEIVNQGFVTSRLEAELVGNAPVGVKLDFLAAPLTGVPEEQRVLQITLAKPGPTDLTIAFRAHNEAPDLGGRDQIHFLTHCLQSH